MGLESKTRPMPQMKSQRCQKYLCDGISRFTPKGAGVQMSYGDAYDYIFQDAKGYYQPVDGAFGETVHVHTRESVKRLTALNTLYLSRPSSRMFLQVEYVKMRVAKDAADKAKREEEKAAKAIPVEGGSP